MTKNILGENFDMRLVPIETLMEVATSDFIVVYSSWKLKNKVYNAVWRIKSDTLLRTKRVIWVLTQVVILE